MRENDSAPLAWLIQFVIAICSSVLILFQSMGVAGCGEACDAPLLALATNGFFIVAATLLLVTGVLILLLPTRRRRVVPLSRDLWIPALGSGLTVLAAVFAYQLVGHATRS